MTETTNDLAKRLRIKAGVMSMGEKIAWGSDTALMEEAADMIEDLLEQIRQLVGATFTEAEVEGKVGNA